MTIRVGVIGTGIMGADHARLLGSAVSGATLGAVFDIDRDRAAGVAARTPGAQVLDDPHVLIKDGDVDAVVIASSDQTHEEFVLACLAAGKPVICEKPLAPAIDGCRRIVEAEVGGGRRLVSVGFMRRHDAGYLEMKGALDSGRIGAPLLLHNIHRNPSAPANQPGSMLITGSAVHEIDVARWLLGEEVVAVTVHRPRQSRASGSTADPLFLVMQSASGALVDVEVFVNAGYGYDVRCELVGETGTLTLDAPAPVVVRQQSVTGRAIPADWRTRFAEAYRRELQDWVDAIGSGQASGSASGSASAWDGYAATAVAQAGVAALESGTRQTVELDEMPALYR